MMDTPAYKVIGKPQNHDQHAVQIVTGKADFAGDRLPNAKLYGVLLLSTIARGRIKNIDPAGALNYPGVKAVITHAQCPIWIEEIYYHGQEVAGVVADDINTAVRAAQLVKVVYEPGTAVLDPDEAIKPGSAHSGILPGVNSRLIANHSRGDIDAGFQQADVVLNTAQPWSPTYQHNTLEPHQAVAWWTGEDLYIWTTTQHVHSLKNALASVLNMPHHHLHAFTHFTGCGHGDKTNANAATVAAVMSKAVNGAPVHFAHSRRDNLSVNTRQFSVRSDITLGARTDGTLTAIDARFWADGGRNSVAPMGNVHYGLRTSFKCPSARFQVTGINTNSPPRGFWRCVNDPPGAVNYDVALDKLAHRMNIDPYDLRLHNLTSADAPDQDPPFYVWGGTALRECLEWVSESGAYLEKRHAPGARPLAGGSLHGIAVTGHIDSHGTVSGEYRGAIITMTPGGQALLNIGGARGSEGGLTSCVHIVAEVLGMTYENVRVSDWGSTDTTLDAGMQAGSTFTASAGSAFYNAALDLRAKLFGAAVNKPALLGAGIEELDASGGEVFLKSDPARRLSYRQVMAGAPPMAGTGGGWGRILKNRSVGGMPIGSPCNCNGNAATCAEVAVNPETGEVEILGLWNAVDTGRTIFKQGAIKQMLSGTELMAGQALFYGDIYDPATGAVLNTSYLDSNFPTTLDLPTQRFSVQDIESDDAAGPFGAHGIGEPCVTNYSAIVCAIFNATGKWVDMDKGACTPDKVLKALGKA
jgi:xanthine dehydrogenase molybdenum-binding subunit